MNIIVSPHPDDEIIGCYHLIKRGLVSMVAYIDVLTPEKLVQTHAVGDRLGFRTMVLTLENLQTYMKKFLSNDVIFVPDNADNHPLHKAVNLVARMSGCSLGYYTTDMNTGYVRELPDSAKKEKKEILDECYPDQKSLWEHDWKYFLFEGTVYDTFTTPTALSE